LTNTYSIAIIIKEKIIRKIIKNFNKNNKILNQRKKKENYSTKVDLIHP